MTNPQTTQQMAEVGRRYEAMTFEYKRLRAAAADAKSVYKRERAKFITRLTAEGSPTTRAEYQADADDRIADLAAAYRSTQGVAIAARERLAQLKSEFEGIRSVLVNEREADRVHAQGGAA